MASWIRADSALVNLDNVNELYVKEGFSAGDTTRYYVVASTGDGSKESQRNLFSYESRGEAETCLANLTDWIQYRFGSVYKHPLPSSAGKSSVHKE